MPPKDKTKLQAAHFVLFKTCIPTLTLGQLKRLKAAIEKEIKVKRELNQYKIDKS